MYARMTRLDTPDMHDENFFKRLKYTEQIGDYRNQDFKYAYLLIWHIANKGAVNNQSTL